MRPATCRRADAPMHRRPKATPGLLVLQQAVHAGCTLFNLGAHMPLLLFVEHIFDGVFFNVYIYSTFHDTRCVHGAATWSQLDLNLRFTTLISVMPDHLNLTSTCKLRVAAPEPQLDHNFILNFNPQLPLPFHAQGVYAGNQCT